MNRKFKKLKNLNQARRGAGVLKVQNYLWVFGGTYYYYAGYGPGSRRQWCPSHKIERINLVKPESEYKIIIDNVDLLDKFRPENYPNFILRNG